jgi:hypothetical protein
MTYLLGQIHDSTPLVTNMLSRGLSSFGTFASLAPSQA